MRQTMIVAMTALTLTMTGAPALSQERGHDPKKNPDVDPTGVEMTVVAKGDEENPLVAAESFEKGDTVVTVCGPATVIKTARSGDNIVELELNSWTLANGKHPLLCAAASSLRASSSSRVSSPSSSSSPAPSTSTTRVT